MATFYLVENVHNAQTQTQIPTPHFCIVKESDPESESGNVIKPLEGMYELLLEEIHWYSNRSILLNHSLFKGHKFL